MPRKKEPVLQRRDDGMRAASRRSAAVGERLSPAMTSRSRATGLGKQMTSGGTAEEFQRRRRRAALVVAPCLLLAVLGLLLTDKLAAGKDWFEMAMIGFFACGMIGGLIGVSIYRCPSCDTVPYDQDGVPLNPVRCSKCGAKLR